MTRLRRRSARPSVPDSIWIGRDEWGVHQYLHLAGVAGITGAGLPGYGKTSLASGGLCQLAPHVEFQFVIIDGKGGGDYDDWADRAWLFCGDNLNEAASSLKRLFNVMRDRQRRIRAELGTTNFWHVGPSPAWPVVLAVIDECHTFFTGPKRDRDTRERCEYHVEQLVKKGRSVGIVTMLLTQKQTGDSIPTSIRDVCEVGLSFACKTREAAKAALGEAIRDYPGVCPTTLQDRAYVGVCVASLPGVAGFVRLRVPYVDPVDAASLAGVTAYLHRDLAADDQADSTATDQAA